MGTVTLLYYVLFLSLLIAGGFAVAVGMTINAQDRAEVAKDLFEYFSKRWT